MFIARFFSGGLFCLTFLCIKLLFWDGLVGGFFGRGFLGASFFRQRFFGVGSFACIDTFGP